MLFAFAGMLRFGISASLLSLGAIDFGMIVDSSVVMVENCVRHIADPENRRRKMVDVVRDAAIEVRKPTMFGELIIMIVYLPILTLEGTEGHLFRPMAHRDLRPDGFDGPLAHLDASARQPIVAAAHRRREGR
jgi:cobalt-zinc-cadmium resistance protein CzcA